MQMMGSQQRENPTTAAKRTREVRISSARFDALLGLLYSTVMHSNRDKHVAVIITDKRHR